jgi:hypothetical protein
MWALEHFHKYLYRWEFHLGTNHSALTWLMSFKNFEGKIKCWIQRLQEYNFTSEHCRGQKHNNADALLWWPCQEACTHRHRVKARSGIKQVQTIMARAAASWDPAALRTELNDQDTGPILK